jgi:hypothetical protein
MAFASERAIQREMRRHLGLPVSNRALRRSVASDRRRLAALALAEEEEQHRRLAAHVLADNEKRREVSPALRRPWWIRLAMWLGRTWLRVRGVRP